MLDREPDLHHLLFVGVTSPDGSPESRLEALEVQIASDDGIGSQDAGMMAEALVLPPRVVTQERHQFNWSATGLDVLTTTLLSYALGVGSGLTVEGLKAAIDRWPLKRGAGAPAPFVSIDHTETEAWRLFLPFLRRAFLEMDPEIVSCEADSEGGWRLVAKGTGARYSGRIYPGDRVLTARRQSIDGRRRQS